MRAFGGLPGVWRAGVLIQSGGKRLRAPGPEPLVEVPDIQFELFFEIAHPMSPWQIEPVSRYHSLPLAENYRTKKMTYKHAFEIGNQKQRQGIVI